MKNLICIIFTILTCCTQAFAHQFNDQRLEKHLKRHPQGMIYIWSPYMPLSVKGLAEAKAVAKKNNLSFLSLLDPYAHRPKLNVLASEKIINLQVLNHFPSVVFHKNGRLLKNVLQGYEVPEGLEIYTQKILNSSQYADEFTKSITWDNTPTIPLFKTTETKAIKIDQTPSFFFKVSSTGEYLSYTLMKSSVGQVGDNYLLDTQSGEKIMIPGPWDPVFNFDQQTMTIPIVNSFGLHYGIYDFKTLQSQGKSALPLFEDQSLSGYYQSVGILSQTSAKKNYRIITEGRSSHQMRDYEYDSLKNNITPTGTVTGLCQNVSLKLPMISKDGTEIAGYDTSTGTTKVFSIDSTGACTETLDLGFQTGKVNFSPNKRFLVFHIFSSGNPGAVFILKPGSSSNSDIFGYDRQTKTTFRLTENINANSLYPDFLADNSVVYAYYPHNSTEVTFKFIQVTDPRFQVSSFSATPNFSELNEKIIKPKCVACHNETRPSGHVYLETYNDIKEIMVPGIPEQSLLYISIIEGASIRMPFQTSPLNSKEIAYVYDWIKLGGPEF
jgi:hypothetical protein